MIEILIYCQYWVLTTGYLCWAKTQIKALNEPQTLIDAFSDYLQNVITFRIKCISGTTNDVSCGPLACMIDPLTLTARQPSPTFHRIVWRFRLFDLYEMR